MKIDLPVGTRATLDEFIDSYTPYFLMKYGYNQYAAHSMGINKAVCQSVETKYGEVVVHHDDILTYVGNKKWSVTRDGR
ncbi:hypothetical protein [Lactobacillus crispatus]|uniref:hypothetical protein n=1 Tax=Lactobacillus crispatus TaxID=47770 RepID=UPI00103AC3B0|nr:hypothetical protein [Lactobacillus crispatus]